MQVTVSVLRIARSFLKAPFVKQYAGGLSKDYKLPLWEAHKVLTRLEQVGWLKGETERVDRFAVGRNPRRLYEITPTGKIEMQRVWDLLAST